MRVGTTVYFCWVCESPAPEDALVARHYETGRVLRFCGVEHWSSYLDLLHL